MDNNIQAGQMIGPYRIIEQIGQGGMATVYKAYHAAVDRYVAIKVLPRHFALDAQFTGRFKQEAKFIANLEHPHILPIYDYGESDGLTYLVMRYLDAGTLRDRIAAGRLSLAEIDNFFSQIADALDYAHTKGVVHRDLKPANVLIDSRGSAFLTDFGIAKIIEGTSHFTNTGAVIGTPVYMSPEQGQGLKLDQRSDIYSLGIVLYEMVTGRVPYNAETPFAIIFKHLYDPLPLPSTIRPDIADPIERVILKALAKNPADRFPSAKAFHESWKKALAGLDTMGQMAASPPNPTILSPAASTVVAPIPPAPSTTPQTKQTVPGRNTPLKWLIGGALTLIGLFLVIALALIGLSQISGRLQDSLQNGDSQEPGVEDLGEPINPPVPFTQPNHSWTSYTNPNIIRALAIHDDQLITGGFGTIAFWNRQDGTLIDHFNLNDGLPNDEIQDLWVDPDGTIWAATARGLGYYDPASQQWATLTDGLPSESIAAVIRRQNGQLLIGTFYAGDNEGLSFYDGENWVFFPDFPSTGSVEDNPEMLSATVTALAEDQEGNLWAGTFNGLGFFNGEAWERFSVDDGLPSNEIISLGIDQDNRVLIGTADGAAIYDGGEFVTIPNSEGNFITGILQSQDGVYWVTGEDPGLIRFDLETNQVENYPDNYYWSGATQDEEGNLYFGSYEGVFHYNNGDFTLWHEANTPSLDDYSRILLAPDNLLWFVNGNRVDIFDPETEIWTENDTIPCCVTPIAFDDSGRVWAGNYGELWLLSDTEQLHLTQDDGVAGGGIFSVAFFPDGSISFGTELGVMLMENDRPVLLLTAESAGFASDKVCVVFADSQNTLWVGTDFGLSHLLPGHIWQHYTIGDPFGDGLTKVVDISEGPDGAIWIATAGDGLYRFADEQFQRFMSENPESNLPPPYLHTVAVSPDGEVWVGADYGGLYRFDGQNWSYFGVADGMASNNIQDILITPDGTVWAAGSYGLNRYTP